MTGSFELQVLGDLPMGLLAEEAGQLELSLGRNGLTVKPYEAEAQPGQKGIVADLTKRVVHATIGPIGGKLLEGLKQYFVREQSVVVELTKPDGAKIRIEAKNVGSDKVAAFLGLAKDALE